MALMRVLQNGLKLQTKNGEIAAGDSVCGSMAKHFVVSPDGALSFYAANEVDCPDPRRIALGVMLAKLLGGRARLDDTEACLVQLEAVNAIGVKAFNDKAGETPLPDVNQSHWAVENVTIRRLAELVVAALTPQLDEIFVSKFQIVLELEKAIESGELRDLVLNEQAVADIADAKKTKAYKRLVRQLTLEKQRSE